MSRAKWEMGAGHVVTQQPSSTKGFEHRNWHEHTTTLSMFPHFKNGEKEWPKKTPNPAQHSHFPGGVSREGCYQLSHSELSPD